MTASAGTRGKSSKSCVFLSEIAMNMYTVATSGRPGNVSTAYHHQSTARVGRRRRAR